MISRYFKVLLLLTFLLATVLVVVIQYNSIKNIDELVTGNETLMEEFRMKNKLQVLQNEVLTMDNRVRSVIILNKPSTPALIKSQIDEVRNSVQELGKFLGSDSTKKYWEELHRLSEEKITFSELILETFSKQGRLAAENIINTQNGVRLTEAIVRTSAQLENARQTYLTRIVVETDANSQKAKRFGFVLAIIAIGIVLLAFGFISNRLRKQQVLIEQLNESEKLQRQASKVKEHFIANMSHEIRTPMNAILGFTNLLRKRPMDSKSSLFVDSIHNSSEKLLSIINDVLDLSKIEAGMMRIEKSQFSFRELISSVEDMLHAKAEEKKLLLDYHIDNEIPDQLIGDPVRISQVLVNLISNAIKFTEKGRIEVTSKLINVADGRAWLDLQIADKGIGIAAEQLEKIFDRFTQAEESTTRRYGGTGLGLSIVQQIVTLMEGTIAVESELGKGAIFKVQLPLEIATQPQNKKHLKTVGEGDPVLSSGGIRILVVEDNAMNQMLMEHLLEAWGCDFIIVANGLEAVNTLETESFDLVLMDIQMPEMDGYTASKLIRSELKLTVPIVAMTAHAFEGEKEKCIAAGMDDYLSKPIREEELSAIIERYSKLANEEKSKGKNTKVAGNIINLNYLREISGGSTKFEREILRQFTVQAPKELRDLENAFDQKQWQAVRSNAHTLKTTTSFLGLQGILLKHLNTLETAGLDDQKTELMIESLNEVIGISNTAINEAKSLLANLELSSPQKTV